MSDRVPHKSMWAALTERAKALLAAARFETELDEEIRFHLDQATDRNIRNGMTRGSAREKALRDFGGQGAVQRTKEDVRSHTGVSVIQDLMRDLRYALRSLKNHLTFTVVVIITIGITLGSNTAVFSLVHSILLRPLPFPESETLVRIYNSYPDAGAPRVGNSPPDFFDRRDHIPALENVALYSQEARTLHGEDGGQHTFALTVTPSFFQVLRVTPAAGRLFDVADETSGDKREVVIGYRLWRSAFGGAADVVGTTARLDGTSYDIIGILPETFRFSSWDAQVFVPITFSAESRSDASRHSDGFQMIGRLATGSSIFAAQQQIDALNDGLVANYPADLHATITSAGYRTVVREYLDDLTRDVRAPFLLMWGGVLLVLVIGAANVTSLFLIRGRSRSREIAARMALGASRMRIVRQLVTESTLVCIAGGMLGLMLASWSLGLLGAFEVYEIPRVDDVSLNGMVVAFSAIAVVLLGAMAGAAPAFGLTGPKNQNPLTGSRGGIDHSSSRLHRVLVSAQIALAFVLVMGAGLLVSGLRNLTAVDPGFNAEQVVTAAIALPGARYADGTARRQFATRFLDAAAAVPGVTSISTASQLPFSGIDGRGPFYAEGIDRGPGDAVELLYRTAVSPDYFKTLSMGVLAGRGFHRADDESAERVAVIDETLAKRHWPSGNAIGQRIWFGSQPSSADEARTIVGVVETIKQNALTESQPPGAIYYPVAQDPLSFMRVAAKLQSDRATIWPHVQEQLKAIDPGLILFWSGTLTGSVDDSLILRRTPMQLLSAFALIGLFLGVLGVYGVIAYAVSRRRKEIGLRMAIGSTGHQIVSLIGKEWIAMVGAGIVLGLGVTLFATRILNSLLYGTGALNPLVLVSTLGIIIASALLSCFLPLRRAVNIDPANVLKAE